MAIAGKVAITSGGEWSASVAYDKLVVVTYNNDLYLSKKANTGVTPTDTENWQLLIKNVTQEQYESILNGTTAVGNALKLNGLTADEFVSNENLLINSDFKNPVNSSGKTSWSGNVNGIDNWVFESSGSGSAIILTDNGLQVTFDSTGSSTYVGIVKKIVLEPNEKYMLSFSIDNTVYTQRLIGKADVSGGVRPQNMPGYIFYIPSSNTIFIRIYKSLCTDYTATLNWAKLELGSIATPFIPPNKEVEKLKCGKADADTVDGKHASDLNENIKEHAPLFVNGTNYTSFSSAILDMYSKGYRKGEIHISNYAPTDIPIANVKYGVLRWRSSAGNAIFSVEFYADRQIALYVGTLQRGENNNAIQWGGQNALANKVLPLDGSVPMSGYLTALEWIDVNNRNDNTKKARVGNNVLNGNAYLICYDSANAKWRGLNIDLSTDMGNGLQYFDAPNGVETYYTVLHTGNSHKVLSGGVAPTDTSGTTIWIDTVNKVIKKYVDGAWTIVA